MRFLNLAFWNKVQFSVLLAGAIVAGGLWGFVEISEEVLEGSSHELDTRILLMFRTPGDPDNPIGPLWVEEAMRDITALGSASVLILITAGVVLYLLMTGRRSAALMVFVSVAGGQVLSSLLKLGIDRPRPELVSHLAEVYTMSFPSGHAMLSAVTYLTLGALLARIEKRRATKIYVLSVAVLITVLVGASRVYLGVHWPSDVLAGWCAGFAWAMLCWLAANFLRQRGGLREEPMSLDKE